MVWELVAYDTEARNSRERHYTSSEITAELWAQIPRIQFTDNGHGIVFQAHAHAGKRKPVTSYSSHATLHLSRLRAARRAAAKLPSLHSEDA